MSDKRRGLGRGIGALIPPTPQVPAGRANPVDVFFPPSEGGAGARAASALLSPPPEQPTDAGSEAEAPAPRRRSDGTDDVSRETQADASGLVAVPGAQFAEIALTDIRPNSRQPRQVFEQDALAELVQSITEVGVLQPVVVRATNAPHGEPYELIMGERRWRASQLAGLATVPAIIRGAEDEHMLRDALLENLHRSELNPLEEAAAYQQLLDDFGCTQDELSQRIGRSRPQISNTLRLLRLAPGVQRRVAAGVLSAGHARALLGLEDPAEAERLASRVVAEGLSVRAVEEIVTTGGRSSQKVRALPRAGTRQPLLDSVASRLSDRLDTRVSVALGRSKGRMTVEFATIDDLERILSVLDPGGPGLTYRPGPDSTPT